MKVRENLISSQQKLATLSSQEIEIVQRDSHELWSGGVSLEARILKVQAILNYPDHPMRYLGLKAEDLVLSSAKVYECEALLNGQPQKLLGLGALFTPNEHRRKGYCRKLIELISEMSHSQGYQAMYLWSDIGLDFYQQMGFHPLAVRRVSYPVTLDEHLMEGVSVNPAHVEDIPKMKELKAQFNKKLDFEIVRKANRWNFWRLLNHSVDLKVFFKNELIGYFTAAQEHPSDYFWLEEAFAMPGHEQRVRNAIFDRAAYHSKNTIKGWDQICPMFEQKPVEKKTLDKPIPMVKFFAESDHEKFQAVKNFYLSSVDHF